MTFWDSSALAPLIFEEPDSATRENQLWNDPQIVVWYGTLVELESAIARRLRGDDLAQVQACAARLKLEHLAQTWIEVDPSETVRARAVRLVRLHPLRTGDAFQLAAALVVTGERPDGHRFLTADARLKLAAQMESFQI